MEIRIRSDGSVINEQTFRASHNVAFPLTLTATILDAYVCDPVLASPAPTITSAQTCSRNGVVQDTFGNWVWAWLVQDVPAEIIAANLEAAKLAKNLQINQWRGEANQSTFSHLGKQIACDQLSRSDIDGVAGSITLTGAFPTGWQGAWKCVDNTIVPIPDVAAFKAMYNSMTSQGATNFAHSQALKETLAAATTVEQVGEIVWAP